jgi:tRNA-splicing ligase RtcB
MDLEKLTRVSEFEWHIEPSGAMRVPGVIFADEGLVAAMDEKVFEQVANVATLPGIVKASYAMPDAHWGYGFPIGGVAAFDPDEGGVVSAGGVGFDISCGVRCMLTGLARERVEALKPDLADALFAKVPAGVGSTGRIRLEAPEMDAMLEGGARWAFERGYGEAADLDRIEEHGRMQGAQLAEVSKKAKRRQRDEMGTLGSGNHYLEVQERPASDCARARWWSRFTAARAASATRSAPSSCERWRSPPPRAASCCQIASSPARRSTRRSARATWAPCAPASTARSPTGRSSGT